MPEYYGYVYQVYDNLHNKFYIGQHAKPEFDKNYYGSGIYIKRAVKKYGKENFTISAVYWAKDKDELNRMEEYVVGAYLGQDNCYNLYPGGIGCHDVDGTIKERIAKSMVGNTNAKGKKRTNEQKKRSPFNNKEWQNKYNSYTSESRRNNIDKKKSKSAETKRKIIEERAKNPTLTQLQIAILCGVSRRTVISYIGKRRKE